MTHLSTVQMAHSIERMFDRASMVTFKVPFSKLTSAEKDFVVSGVYRMQVGDTSYGGAFKRYILVGGKIPTHARRGRPRL